MFCTKEQPLANNLCFATENETSEANDSTDVGKG